MANIHVDAQPLIAKTAGYPATIGEAPTKIRAAKAKAPQMSGALEAMASALTNVQGSLNNIHATLRQNTQAVQQIYVTDNTGKVIAAIGDFEYQGVVTPNYFSEIHVGDPLNTGNPALALFNAANGQVTIGQNGAIEVLDPFGNDAAWIGTQADTEAVTGAVASPTTPLIRLTITGHTYSTGDTPTFQNVGGVPNATGIFAVTVIDANTVDLQNSVFVGTYTSGGTGTRILHISGAANNGSGLIRIQTTVAHGYVTGDEVNVVAVGGVPNADGQWVITVIDSTHFDLVGSTFAGAYTSGGTCLRYFAGMLAQTIAIGPSFPSYKLRAFADGSLKISNATIELSDVSGGITSTILIDPSPIEIVISRYGGAGGNQVLLKDGSIQLQALDSSGNVNADGASSTIDLSNIDLVGVGLSTITLSELLNITGYTGSDTFGPVIALNQLRGIPSAPVNTVSGDTIGGLVANGNANGDSPGNEFDAGIIIAATQNFVSGSSRGTQIQMWTTPNTTRSSVQAVTVDQDGRVGIGPTVPGYALDVTGDINSSGVFRNGGAAGISPTITYGISLSLVTVSNAVRGTPGTGQSNFTAVSSVTLNTASHTFTGGIITA